MNPNSTMNRCHGGKGGGPRVVAAPPLIFAAGAAIGACLQIAMPVGILDSPAVLALGVSLVVVSVCLTGWAIRVMDRAGTTHGIRTRSTALVTTGPFGWSRNPLYLSLSLCIAGIALALDALWLLAALVPIHVVLHVGVIRPEEHFLEQTFGDVYAGYRRRVRRWL